MAWVIEQGYPVKTLALVLACAVMLGAGPVHARGADPVATSHDSLPAAAASNLSTKLEKLYAVEESRGYSGNERIDAIVVAYEDLFAGEGRNDQLASIADADLELLYRAAYTASFYSGDPVHANEVIRLFGALENRELIDRSHRVQLYGTLVGARMFDRARAFQRTYPDDGLEILPLVRHAPNLAGPTAWAVDPIDRVLVEQAIDLEAPSAVVVVSHPGCHFSQAAVAAIEADPVLGPLFAQHANWLAPPSTRVDFDPMQRWNREHPDASVSLAIRRGDWPLIDNWSTPTFYFFRNGKIEAQVIGWPLDGVGRRQEVVDALQTIGLLEQSTDG